MTHDRLDEEIVAFASAWDVPGGVVVVSDPGAPDRVFPFGHADRASAAATTERHRFEIGSISKVATALVVLRLVADGALSLDEEVAAILPWLPSGLRAPGVTIRRLLQHGAGIPASFDGLQDDRAQLLSADPPAPRPGRRFHYSNVGYLMLGRVACRVAGTPLMELVEQGVFAPAGMTESVAAVTADGRDRLATGYWPARRDRPWLPGDPLEAAPFLEVAGADGNIAATASDLAAFGRFLLDGGGLPADLSARMRTDVGPGGEDVLELAGLPPIHSSRYGLGVNVEHVAGRTALTHGGGMVGFASFLHSDVDTGRVVAVVTNANGDSPVAEALARAVAADAPDVLVRLRPTRWAEERAGLPRAIEEGMVGTFGALTIRRLSEGLQAELDGVAHPLLWTWGGRILTAHPALARFGLVFDGRRWISGARVFARGGASVPPASDACCGRYRAFTPWFPEFRIVARDGGLRLVAPGGVESVGDDVALIPSDDGGHRIGDDPDSTERLRFGPVIDGRCAWVDLNGCRYSRAFAD